MQRMAAADFFERAATTDISPVRFFDPIWVRANYPTDGVNAFLSLRRQPLDTGSSRHHRSSRRAGIVEGTAWFARRKNPLLHFLLGGDEALPPSACWMSNS